MPIPISGTGQGTITAFKGGTGLSTIVDTDMTMPLQQQLMLEREAATRRRALITKRMEDISDDEEGEYWFQDQQYFAELGQTMLGKGTELLASGANIFDEFSPDYYKWSADKNKALKLRAMSMQQKGYYDVISKAYNPDVHKPESFEAVQDWARKPFEERMNSGPPPGLERRGWEVEPEFFDNTVAQINQGIQTALNSGDFARMENYRTYAIEKLDETALLLVSQGQDPAIVTTLREKALAAINVPLLDLSAQYDRQLKAWQLRQQQAGIDEAQTLVQARNLIVQGTNAGDPKMLGFYAGAKYGDRPVIGVEYGMPNNNALAPSGNPNQRYMVLTLAPQAVAAASTSQMLAGVGANGQPSTSGPLATRGQARSSAPALPPGAIQDKDKIFIPIGNSESDFWLNGLMNTSPSAGGVQIASSQLITNNTDEGVFAIAPTLEGYTGLRFGKSPVNSYSVWEASSKLTERGVGDDVLLRRQVELLGDLASQNVPVEDAQKILVELLMFGGGQSLRTVEQNKHQAR